MGIWFCDKCMVGDGLHVNNLMGYFRSSHQRYSIKTGVLKILENSYENTCS